MCVKGVRRLILYPLSLIVSVLTLHSMRPEHERFLFDLVKRGSLERDECVLAAKRSTNRKHNCMSNELKEKKRKRHWSTLEGLNVGLQEEELCVCDKR